ncbi:Glutathione S-transferase-like protein 6 [Elsinoe fawcettii]|nr:Glutathione S-transferase-like protein 6 [Elsinoe fawcettii]
MPNDDSPSPADGASRPASTSRSPQSSWTDVFALPRPLREVFSKFPLTTYPANELPARSPSHQGKHALYIFSTVEGAPNGEPSYNPTCLKWQTYMKLRGIDFTTIASNNHASPSGSLPFILPSPGTSQGNKTSSRPAPIPGNKIKRWVDDQLPSSTTPQSHMKEDIYLSLLDHRLRRAWLHQLYLSPPNTPLLTTLYATHSSSPLITFSTLHTLRAAASAEISKSNSTGTITEAALQEEGQQALDALEELLEKDDWFFGAKEPGLFDAAVFAYTHLLLEEELEWGWNGLGGYLKGKRGLVGHRRRVWKKAYGRR